MCDTVIATASATADGVTIFGKNSDREPNEAHHLLAIPAAEHAPDTQLQCTYMAIPQVSHTYAVLLAKPFWIWGAEMGTNEHNVVIGNEALFTKVPYEKGPALLGMDLLRLALERSKTAREALGTITALLAEYGQGGNCGFTKQFYYHNSFIIADPQDAWVLETAGPHWAAKHIDGIYTISNGITIGSEWDLASANLVSHAIEQRWCRSEDDFDFSRCYSDTVYTYFSDCRGRCEHSTAYLTARQGEITIATVMAALRDHGVGRQPARLPASGLLGSSVCMHAGFGKIRGDQTTGSMVSYLHPEQPTHFVTGTAAPCTSLFKPVWLEAQLPDMGPQPTGTYDEATLFWRHEALHRETLRDYGARINLYQAERDALERQFVADALARATASPADKTEFVRQCFATANQAEAAWLADVKGAPISQRPGMLYRYAWDQLNQKAKMPAN